MNRHLGVFIAIPGLALAGCCTTAPLRQALDADAIGKVQGEIKRQVGVYIRAAQTADPAATGEFWCGSGKLDFDISTVKAELTTTIENISSGNLALKIPVSAVTLGPSGGVKRDVTNTEVLDYNLWPLATARQNPDLLGQAVTQDELKGAPVAQVLLALRHALILSAQKSQPGPQACFTDYIPDKPASDAGNTFKIGLTMVSDTTGGLEIKVGIIDLTASQESKGTTGNTLTVAFVQRGLAILQLAKDAVDTECKYPKQASDACKKAKARYQKLQDITGGIGILESDIAE
jgi:hypothetical protein